MEKRFLVKVTCWAKPNNKNFKGVIQVFHYGKGEHLCGAHSVGEKDEGFKSQDITLYDLREYGYKRECDAKKAYSYKHHKDEEYWKVDARIEEYEI